MNLAVAPEVVQCVVLRGAAGRDWYFLDCSALIIYRQCECQWKAQMVKVCGEVNF